MLTKEVTIEFFFFFFFFFFQAVEIKYYNTMIDGKSFFDQPVKNYQRTYDNIWEIVTTQRDNYTTGCLLDYVYFKSYYKIIAIDLSKQQVLDVDPKAIQQINFTRNLEWVGQTAMYFITKEAKESILDFSQGTVKILWIYLALI